MTTFNKRAFGCVLVKSINSNYNADFSHQPRTLPDGVVYATDKALKFAVKHFLKKEYGGEKILYFKNLKNDFIPMSLEEAYAAMNFENKGMEKTAVAGNLLSCLDIRLFGATFAMKSKDGNVAISIHGPVQINHGVNIWRENNIFSEQIASPFRNPDEKSAEKEATTLGRQSKLQEGHYLHHFSVNPKNLSSIIKAAGQNAQSLSEEDIAKLKTALRTGVTYYDSSAKAGTDNEMLIWVQLNENSKRVLPNFSQLVKIDKKDGKVVYDLGDLKAALTDNDSEIEAVEIYYLKESVALENAPASKTRKYDLNSGNEIQ
ncbi:MAG: type I CRISPR-associated protein Cas7 [Saprospiraceae bacterium]|nr:type I CRISPR-associated protein Cas7 [Saprospiraceae bacterium]